MNKNSDSAGQTNAFVDSVRYLIKKYSLFAFTSKITESTWTKPLALCTTQLQFALIHCWAEQIDCRGYGSHKTANSIRVNAHYLPNANFIRHFNFLISRCMFNFVHPSISNSSQNHCEFNEGKFSQMDFYLKSAFNWIINNVAIMIGRNCGREHNKFIGSWKKNFAKAD